MNDDDGACRGAWVDECGGDDGLDDHQCGWEDVEAVALEKCRAFGELADLAGANAAEKRPVAESRFFSGKRVRACEAA